MAATWDSAPLARPAGSDSAFAGHWQMALGGSLSRSGPQPSQLQNGAAAGPPARAVMKVKRAYVPKPLVPGPWPQRLADTNVTSSTTRTPPPPHPVVTHPWAQPPAPPQVSSPPPFACRWFSAMSTVAITTTSSSQPQRLDWSRCHVKGLGGITARRVQQTLRSTGRERQALLGSGDHASG